MMADYYPLIARAVAGLEKNTGEGRRNVYERAREALLAQLRGLTPALSESDVTRERLALEEAIRKVEAESARASRIDTTTKFKAPEFPRWLHPEAPPAPSPPPPARERVPPPMRQDARLAQAASARPEPRSMEPQKEPVTEVAAEPRPRGEPPPRHEPVPREASMPPASPQTAAPARHADAGEDVPAGGPGIRLAPERPMGRALNSGLRNPREANSEAAELDGAGAPRSARESYAAVPGAAPDSHRAQKRPPKSQEPDLEGIGESLEPSFTLDDSRPLPPRQRPALPPQPRIGIQTPPPRALGIASGAAILLGLVLLLAWQLPNMLALYRTLGRAPASDVASDTPAPAASAPAVKGKIADRIEPGGAPVQRPDLASAAQHVVLYEEDPNDPQGKRWAGSAVWQTESVSPGTGKPPELGVRANIEIPDRKMSIAWTLRRETDQNRSTSHTIEIVFKLPSDFSNGSVFNVPGVRVSEAELTPGTALAGLSVRVTNGYFLIGLSATPAERDRNIQLLKDRDWFEIPIVYTNNRRAILAMEKGTPGERAFAQAFAAWGK